MTTPILPWVGGKRQLLHHIMPLVPDYTRYVEPFIGGGALFFKLQPSHAICNDINSNLVNFYKESALNTEYLITLIKKFEPNENRYFTLQAIYNSPHYNAHNSTVKAAIFFYLVVCGYGNLWRENKTGKHNVPPNPSKKNLDGYICKIRRFADYYNNNAVILHSMPYESIFNIAKNNDFYYLDPPYIQENAEFVNYNKNGFSLQDSINLKNNCDLLTSKGVKFLLSNSDTFITRDLFKSYDIIEIKANRTLSSAKLRTAVPTVGELLIKNY